MGVQLKMVVVVVDGNCTFKLSQFFAQCNLQFSGMHVNKNCHIDFSSWHQTEFIVFQKPSLKCIKMTIWQWKVASWKIENRTSVRMGFQAVMSEREQLAFGCIRTFPCQGKRFLLKSGSETRWIWLQWLKRSKESLSTKFFFCGDSI